MRRILARFFFFAVIVLGLCGSSGDAGSNAGDEPDDGRSRGNSGTCAVMVNVALTQARREAIKGSATGAARCPARILHAVSLQRGAAPVTGEVHLNDQLTLQRQAAHEKEVCAYNAIIPCPDR